MQSVMRCVRQLGLLKIWCVAVAGVAPWNGDSIHIGACGYGYLW